MTHRFEQILADGIAECSYRLAAHGFETIRNVPGSWKAWSAAGYPVETPEQK